MSSSQPSRGPAGARWRPLVAALALVAAAAAPALATNGPRLTAKGARAAGRGGVDYAYADDGIGPSNNPAGMAFRWGNRLDNNWLMIIADDTWRNQFGSFGNDENPHFIVPAFSFGATFDPSADWEVRNVFRLGDWGLKDPPDEEEAAIDWESLPPDVERYGSRWRVGFGVFPITGGKVSLGDMRTPGFSQPLDWEVDAISLAVTPSLAYRFNEHFALGINLQLLYSTFELDGGIAQQSAVLRDDFEFAQNILSVDNQIVTRADTDDAFTWGFSWRAGLMFSPNDVLTLGLTYQDRTYSADYLGRATVGAEDQVARLTNGNTGLLQVIEPNIDPSLGFTSEYDLRIQDYEFPRQLGLGFVLRLHRRFSFGFDYTFINWSELFRTFKARLSDGDNRNLDLMTSPSVRVRLPLDYRDQHVFAFGLTVLALEGADLVEGVPSYQLVLRAGYNYAESPVPRSTTLPQLPVIAEHHISSGFTFHWGPLVEFSFAWEWALPETYEIGFHRGDNLNLSNSEHEVGLMLFHFGLGVNF